MENRCRSSPKYAIFRTSLKDKLISPSDVPARHQYLPLFYVIYSHPGRPVSFAAYPAVLSHTPHSRVSERGCRPSFLFLPPLYKRRGTEGVDFRKNNFPLSNQMISGLF
jgi:hypothetical protein